MKYKPLTKNHKIKDLTFSSLKNAKKVFDFCDFFFVFFKKNLDFFQKKGAFQISKRALENFKRALEISKRAFRKKTPSLRKFYPDFRQFFARNFTKIPK